MKKLITTICALLVLTITPILTNAASTTHVVKKGETFSSISKKYNVPTEEIKKANAISSNKIKVGQKLVIPQVEYIMYKVKKKDTLKSIAKSNNTTVKQLQTWNKLSSTKIKVGQLLKVSIVLDEPNGFEVNYVVKKGDTLTKIAKKFNTTVVSIKNDNSLLSDKIFIGQTLKIITNEVIDNPVISPKPDEIQPGNGSSNDSIVNNPNSDIQGTNPLPPSSSTYTVVKGDTLASISQKFAITIDKIIKDNNLKSNTLKVGTKLVFNQITSQEIVDIAKKYLGVPYLFGGNNEFGIDCSGYINLVFNEAGIKINRLSTAGYWEVSKSVDYPKVGELVFFQNTYKDGPSHMGIYVGNGQFIHADATKGVMISSLQNSYYANHFLGYGTFQ